MTSSLIPINTNLNIVVDTNQFLSVFVFHGKLMRLVFDLVIDEKIHLYVSSPLKDEVREKLQFFAVSKEGQK
jgi:predicted nucleic acid-binding protein